MPQAAQVCTTPVLICAARYTRLNADGSLAPGPDNVIISNSPISLGLNPDVVTGTENNVVGGCGCICVSFKAPDSFIRFNFDMEFCDLNPSLMELTTGGSLVLDDSDVPVPIGTSWPVQTSCNEATQPPFALEAWSQGYIGNGQAPDPNSFIRFVFPMVFATLDAWVITNNVLTPKLKAWGRSNANWPADGAIYDDYPAGAELDVQGGWFQDSADHVPTAACEFQTASSA